MRVKCTQIVNSITGRVETESPWLTVGRNYTVLALLAIPNREVLLRLLADDQRTPGLYSLRQFTLVSPNLPELWITVLHPDGALELLPREWAKEGFWDSYFDGESRALETFEAVRQQLEMQGS